MVVKTKSSPELDQNIILTYLSGINSYETAKKYKCSQTFVMNILKKHNILTRSTHDYTRKYIVNELFFNKINNEEQAYFLGLLYADGNNYINSKNYEISIKLQSKDKIILEKLRDCICPNLHLKLCIDKRTNNEHFLFKINSKKISEQLSNLGCIPNKSLILKFPDFIETNLLNHFIRGYFDGDGSIYKRKPRKNNYINYLCTIVSSNDFCNSAAKLIKDILGVHSTLYLSCPNRNQITTTLSIGGNKQIKKFLNWLYKDATIYLPRKYSRYNEFKTYSSSNDSSSFKENSSIISTSASNIS